jgi:hypothetical protein
MNTIRRILQARSASRKPLSTFDSAKSRIEREITYIVDPEFSEVGMFRIEEISALGWDEHAR